MGFKEVIYSLIFLPTNNELKMHKSIKSLHIQSIKVAIVAMSIDNSSIVSIPVLFFHFFVANFQCKLNPGALF